MSQLESLFSVSWYPDLPAAVWPVYAKAGRSVCLTETSTCSSIPSSLILPHVCVASIYLMSYQFIDSVGGGEVWPMSLGAGLSFRGGGGTVKWPVCRLIRNLYPGSSPEPGAEPISCTLLESGRDDTTLEKSNSGHRSGPQLLSVDLAPGAGEKQDEVQAGVQCRSQHFPFLKRLLSFKAIHCFFPARMLLSAQASLRACLDVDRAGRAWLVSPRP